MFFSCAAYKVLNPISLLTPENFAIVKPRKTLTNLLLSTLLCVLVTSFCYGKNFIKSPIDILQIDQTQETCNLGNGTITISATGGVGQLFYSIDGGSNFQESFHFENLESGDYLIVVSDGIQCTQVETAQIADAPEPLLNLDYLCIEGKNKANINLSPFDGIGPYQFNWIGPNNETYNSEDLVEVPPGDYSITVTDALGCEIDSSFRIETCCELLVECNLQDTIFLDCIYNVPSEPIEFLDLESIANEDSLALMSLGHNVVSSCNNIIVLSKDDYSDPVGCGIDSLFITRNFTIDDGVTTSYCHQTYVIEKYAPLQIESPATDMSINCDEDIQVAFTNWLSTQGGASFNVCSDPISVSTYPSNPQIEFDCSGNGIADVNFIITDNCGNIDSTRASFYVEDLVPPIITCPQTTEIEIVNTQDFSQLEAWLDLIVAQDNCGTVNTSNDFEIPVLGEECDFTLNVNFSAEDQCGNISECNSEISVINNIGPSISCPPSIQIECNDPQSENLISEWQESSTINSIFSQQTDLSTDFNVDNLNDLNCGDIINVNFEVIDNCYRTDQCISSIEIVDTTNPELICPDEITVSAFDNDVETTAQSWLNNASSTDLCAIPTISDDFDFNMLQSLCFLDEIEVKFTSVDNCNNFTECLSKIVVVKQAPQISCPAPLVVDCNDPNFEDNINDWILTGKAEDESGTELDINTNYNNQVFLLDCDESIEILFQAIDKCNQAASCSTNISIVDEVGPEIISPEPITIDLTDLNYNLEFQSRIETAEAFDNCNNAIMHEISDLNVSFSTCENRQPFEFIAEDECNNISSCLSEIIVLNDIELSMACPEQISVSCSDPQSLYTINDFLSSPSIENEVDVNLSTDFDVASINTDCAETYSSEVEFYVEDECGNTETCLSEITFIPDAKVYIPNIFSPNGDGLNDRFTVYGNESVDIVISILIYNRWGSKIFETTDILPNDEDLGWDGYYNFTPEESNAFTYYVQIRDVFGDELEYTGSIQILK